MKKKYILLLIIFALFSSCMKIDTNVTIDNQFNITQEVTYDYTVTNDTIRKQIEDAKKEAETDTGVIITETEDSYLIKRNNNSWTWSYYFSSTSTINKIKNPCIEFNNSLDKTKENLIIDYNDISCKNLDKTYDKVLISYKWWNILKLVELDNWNYKINLLKILWGKSDNDNTKKQTKEQKEQTLQMLKSMWFESNYSITFPSKIIKSDIWEIDNKRLDLSLSDFYEEDIDIPFVIIEKKDNMPEVIKKDDTINISVDDKKLLTKELILSRNNLSKSFSQKKYINLIDKIVDKLSEDTKKLQRLYKKLEKINTTDEKYRKVIDIIIYLKAKAGLKLYELKE